MGCPSMQEKQTCSSTIKFKTSLLFDYVLFYANNQITTSLHILSQQSNVNHFHIIFYVLSSIEINIKVLAQNNKCQDGRVGLRRPLQVRVREGVGSNSTLDNISIFPPFIISK